MIKITITEHEIKEAIKNYLAVFNRTSQTMTSIDIIPGRKSNGIYANIVISDSEEKEEITTISEDRDSEVDDKPVQKRVGRPPLNRSKTVVEESSEQDDEEESNIESEEQQTVSVNTEVESYDENDSDDEEESTQLPDEDDDVVEKPKLFKTPLFNKPSSKPVEENTQPNVIKRDPKSIFGLKKTTN